MAAPAALPVRHHISAAWAIPLALGAFFGFYAGFLHRTGSPVSWWDVLYGVVAGIVFTALAYGIGRIQGRLIQEVRAAAYGALAGMAVGFLHSLTGDSILSSAWLGVIVAAVTGVSSFYVFHTREP
ncbi:hypothetical protein ACWD4V_03410 [Streptomyces tsukubensis]|uniref:hypothetical protein n=1 Tax=Streptomyces tsukubensis TaxID=83656 RepID=UPI00369E0CC4